MQEVLLFFLINNKIKNGVSEILQLKKLKIGRRSWPRESPLLVAVGQVSIVNKVPHRLIMNHH